MPKVTHLVADASILNSNDFTPVATVLNKQHFRQTYFRGTNTDIIFTSRDLQLTIYWLEIFEQA